jgi:DNA ligase-1
MMRLHDLVDTSRQVASTPARRGKVALLAATLRALAPDEVETGVAYLSGAIRQRRLGAGWAAVSAVRGEPASAPSLELREVDAAFARIATLSGGGSTAERRQVLGGLFARATAEEQEFLARLIVGELRQGALDGVLAEAIARAADVDAAAVRRALMLAGDPGSVARAALAEGAAGLARFGLVLFRPLLPMLAETAEDAADAIARLGRAGLEYKIDGARVQVHRDGEDVRVFSRRLNDVTPAVPEIVAAVRALPVRRIVLDGEVVALRPDGRPEPFQVTMRRFGSRLDVARLARELPLSPVFFDCVHLDGADLLDRPAAERWAALAGVVPEAQRIPRRVAEHGDHVQAFLGAALAAGHEGVVLKSLAAAYEAGRRGASWLKLKPAHTLDLVVLALEWGSGRRRSWLSNLHLGARDPERGGFVMLGKTFKGMTDDMLRWQTEHFRALEIGRDAHVVHVRPETVVEIAFDGVQASPHYPGGVALRFARVRRYRPDKHADQADTIGTVLRFATRAPDGQVLTTRSP